MQYKQMMVQVSPENVEFLREMKSRGQLITDSVNLAIDTYRAIIADQDERRAAAHAKQRLAARQHVDDLFDAIEFRSEVFKKEWLDAVMDKFDYIRE